MNKLLEVYDDLVPLYYQDYIYNLIMSTDINNQFPLYVSGNLSKGKNKDLGFHNHFWTNKKYIGSAYQILYFLAINKKLAINEIFQERVFFQLPSPHPFTPNKHTDIDLNHYTCLYYVNDSDGDTIFYNNNEEPYKKISPKKGRIAFFDGSILHSAGMPSINERIIININFSCNFL